VSADLGPGQGHGVVDVCHIQHGVAVEP
jgi:hypothetical protein